MRGACQTPAWAILTGFHTWLCHLQADKLVFIASQAAVENRGNQKDMYELDVAALCEAEMHEEEMACNGQEQQELQREDPEGFFFEEDQLPGEPLERTNGADANQNCHNFAG